jgi:hypothetical protein
MTECRAIRQMLEKRCKRKVLNLEDAPPIVVGDPNLNPLEQLRFMRITMGNRWMLRAGRRPVETGNARQQWSISIGKPPGQSIPNGAFMPARQGTIKRRLSEWGWVSTRFELPICVSEFALRVRG